VPQKPNENKMFADAWTRYLTRSLFVLLLSTGRHKLQKVKIGPNFPRELRSPWEVVQSQSVALVETGK